MGLVINVSPAKNYLIGGKNADVVTFSLSVVGSDITVYGNEQFFWDFGEVDQPKLTGTGPHTIFYRRASGDAGYTVSVLMEQKLSEELAGTNGTAGQSVFYYTASTTVNVYEFDETIVGPDYIQLNQVIADTDFSISHGQFDDGTIYPQAVVWEIDGKPLDQNTVYGTNGTSGEAEHPNWYPNLSSSEDPLFNEIRRYVLVAKITHGTQTRTVVQNITVTVGNQVFGFRTLTDATPNLMFFNKEGDNLNFDYVEYEPGKFRWTGDMIFNENSNETFKTIGLYTFEKVLPIEYSNTALTLSRFQFFNEHGIDFLAQATDQSDDGLVVDNIDIVLRRTGFKSKWVYGANFHTIFPKGTDVWFENVKITNLSNVEQNLTDFNSDVNRTDTSAWNFNNYDGDSKRRRLWSVVDTKTDAIMVITDTDNETWYNNYKYNAAKPGKIYSANFVRIWYPEEFPSEDFSVWNESWTKIEGDIYDKKKLTLVNSSNNSGVYTVNFRNNTADGNKYLRRFLRIDCLKKENLPAGHGFEITLNFKTNKIFLGREPIDFIPSAGFSFPFQNQKDLIIFESFNNRDRTPALLTEGTVFIFEDDGTTVNFSKQYTVLRRDTAVNVLDINESDRKGWTLTTLNIQNIVADPPTIRIANTNFKTQAIEEFDVVLTNNAIFQNLITRLANGQPLNITLTEMTNLISQEINAQAKGVVTNYVVGNIYSIVNESEGWRISSVQIITKQNNATVSAVFNDPYNGQLPTTGIIGSQTVPLSSNTIGYVYNRTRTRTVHIQTGYDNVNSVPIWYTMAETKIVLWVDYVTKSPVITFAQNLNASVYLNDTKVSFRQLWQNSELLNLIFYAGDPLPDSLISLVRQEQEKMFQRFIISWQSTFDYYGLDLYTGVDELCVGRRYTSYDNPNTTTIDTSNDYVEVLVKSIRFDAGTAGDVLNAEHLVDIQVESELRISYQMEVLEKLTYEINQSWGLKKKPTSVNWSRATIIDDIDAQFGLTVTINGIDYDITFDDIVTGVPANQDDLLDIEETLKDFGLKRFASDQDTLTPSDDSDIGLKYYEQLESLGIIITLEKSDENLGFPYAGTSGYIPYDTLKIASKYPNNVIDFAISGTNDQHKILHSSIEFLVIQNTLAITINGFRYSATGANIYVILQNWLTEHAPRLLDLDIVVEYKDTNILRFSTLKTSTPLKYQIYVGRNAAVGETLYNITDYRPGYTGIILAGNEIIDAAGGLEENNFATGMLVTVTGSKWPLNNQRYNILLVEPTKLVLSYQGPFWNENDYFGDVNDSWMTLYNFSWERFTDPTIYFTYDLLGYDTNNGVVVGYQDLSTTPNPVMWIWDFGDGEMYSQVDHVPTPSESSAGYSYPNPRTPEHTYKSAGKYVVQLIIIDNLGIAHSNSYLITLRLDGSSTSGVDFGNHLALHTEEFLRYPRENYNDFTPVVSYRWRWLEESSEIFYYDFSGSQLGDEGIFTYTGTKPLITDENDGIKIYLNKEVNNDLKYVNDPSRQQTVFEELTYELQKVDSETDITFEPEPMQVFVGYRSDFEGVNTKTLILEKVEDVVLDIKTSKIDSFNIQTNLPVTAYKNVVYIFPEIAELRVERFEGNFIDLNFKPGQTIMINAKDNTNQFGQRPFANNGKVVEISQVGTNWLRFKDATSLKSEVSWQETQNYRSPYNTISTTYDITLILQPIEIARIYLNGQTEIEDDRYKILTQNNGYNVKPNDTFIFSEYDIEENGIDWIFLNAKRKELLVNAPQIYNYIGSYKAIINAINFFGYNDLQFNEYYRNIDTSSKQYGKLYKIEVADIFNNLTEGFKVNDFILGTLPNKRYNKTNLFNLTYQITDFEGNSVLAYTLDEVIVKLQGLKKWLQSEVVPIGKRILDITGHTQNHHEIGISHDLKQVISIDVADNLTPVNFNAEAYLQPIVNSSETYNVHIEFFTEENVMPEYFELKIRTYATEEDFRQEPFTMRPVQTINEFKTDLKAYNFAADLNVDPFILIETITFNGYGEIFKKRRTYSLQSLAFLS